MGDFGNWPSRQGSNEWDRKDEEGGRHMKREIADTGSEPPASQGTASSREEAARAFLAGFGWADARAEPVAGDASNRRYFRLARDGQTAIFMDAPAEKGEDAGAFRRIADFLVANGFSAPRILAADEEAGFLLVEDLGEDLYARVCERLPALEETLYAAAVDALAALGEVDVPPFVAPYDEGPLWQEAVLVADWYLPPLIGAEAAADFREALRETLLPLTRPELEAGPVLVLRDYHAENLLWLPEREGMHRAGMIDFQDALAGHPAYDLLSLLEDARRDTSADLRSAMIDRFLARTDHDRIAFTRDYAVLAAQRNLKILGIFARLRRRDGRQGYLPMLPRVWGHLMRDLSHPALEGLARLVQEHVPPPTAEVLARLDGDASPAGIEGASG